MLVSLRVSYRTTLTHEWQLLFVDCTVSQRGAYAISGANYRAVCENVHPPPGAPKVGRRSVSRQPSRIATRIIYYGSAVSVNEMFLQGGRQPFQVSSSNSGMNDARWRICSLNDTKSKVAGSTSREDKPTEVRPHRGVRGRERVPGMCFSFKCSSGLCETGEEVCARHF